METKTAFWKPAAMVILFLVALTIPLLTKNEYYLHTFIVGGIYILLVLGLNLILGYTGQLSLGHAAFYGIGAYTSALLVMVVHVPFWIALPIAGVVAGTAGLLLGFPALRLKGAYLVICTLAFVEIVHQVMMNWESLTRGPMGIPGVPSPAGFSLGSVAVDFSQKQTYYYQPDLYAVYSKNEKVDVFEVIDTETEGEAVMDIVYSALTPRINVMCVVCSDNSKLEAIKLHARIILNKMFDEEKKAYAHMFNSKYFVYISRTSRSLRVIKKELKKQMDF